MKRHKTREVVLNTPFSAEQYSNILDSLNGAIGNRVEAERQLAAFQVDDLDEDLDPNEVQERLNQLNTTEQAELTAAEEDHNQQVGDIETRFQSATSAIENTAFRQKSEAEEHYQQQTADVEDQYDENRWIMTSLVDESADNNPKKQLETFRTQIERRQERLSADCEELKSLSDQAVEMVQNRRHWREEPFSLPRGPGANREEMETRFDEAAQEAREQFKKLQSQFLSRMLSGTGLIWVGLLLWLPAFGVLAGLVHPEALGLNNLSGTAWLVTSAGVTFALTAFIIMILWFTAARKTWEAFQPFRIHVSDAFQNQKQWRKVAKNELARMEESCEQRHQAMVKHRENSLKRFTSERDEKLQSFIQERRTTLSRIEQTRATQLQAIQETHDHERATAERTHQNRIAQIQSSYETEREQLIGELERQQKEKARQIHECQTRLQSDWNSAITQFQEMSEYLTGESQNRFPSWQEILDETWKPATQVPDGIPLGNYVLNLDHLPNGLPEDPAYLPETTAFSLPTVLPFPHSPSFVLKTGEGGRTEADAIQQAALLRLMSGLPPATVRLTICDPVSLGEPFSAFMHLADYDELLITNRIWTESAHIDEQLAKLTEHLENVFQKYLRNEFETIEEYNQKAGEVAEPY
ncbi:MAG: hypothetical protein KDA84_00180, partial [Planctomycetaceae bacterium]|nr:hypothetical protein [Planctomycetaceae bacterium]